MTRLPDDIHRDQLPDQRPTQDLTPELLRDWLESACIDAVLGDHDDVLAHVDHTTLLIQLDAREGILGIICAIRCEEGVGDNDAWLRGINRLNSDTTIVRMVLEGEGDVLRVDYEHELFAVEGIVTRRQFVKLIRAVRNKARQRHAELRALLV